MPNIALVDKFSNRKKFPIELCSAFLYAPIPLILLAPEEINTELFGKTHKERRFS